VSLAYLGLLTFSLVGLALIDWRGKLAFFAHPLRATMTLLIATAFFLVWDVSGIALGIFFLGQSEQLTGVLLAPQLPLEEPVFLLLLCYTTLIIFCSLSKRGEKK